MFATTPLFRCYPTPIKDKDDPKGRASEKKRNFAKAVFEADSEIAAEINRVGHPHAGPTVLFDCETLTDAHGGQRHRFGWFQERGMRYDRRVAAAKSGTLTREKLDTLWNKGIFYNPGTCTDDEIEVMENYAMEHDVEIMTVDEFVRKILHRNHYVKYADDWKERLREPCLVIGHNSPFDLGSIAIHSGLAKEDLYGGLSLVLSGGEHDEPVMGETDEAFAARVEMDRKTYQRLGETDEAFATRLAASPLPVPRRRGEPGVAKQKFEYRTAIKKVGFGKALYRDGSQINGVYVGDDGKERPRRMQMLHFVDTITMGNALLGPGPASMAALSNRLNVPEKMSQENRRLSWPDHG